MNTSPTGIVAPPLSRTRARTDSKPWYRQFWPWFLIALPAISVIFSFATLYIAVSGADEVIAHEGDSSSYAAPEEPGGEAAAAVPAVQAPASEGDGTAEPGRAAAAPGVPGHGVP